MGHLCILLYYFKLLIFINHVQHSISVRLAHLPNFRKPEALWQAVLWFLYVP